MERKNQNLLWKATNNILSNNIWYLNVCVSVRRCIITKNTRKICVCWIQLHTANGGDKIEKDLLLQLLYDFNSLSAFIFSFISALSAPLLLSKLSFTLQALHHDSCNFVLKSTNLTLCCNILDVGLFVRW
jgi:hypothetical protein